MQPKSVDEGQDCPAWCPTFWMVLGRAKTDVFPSHETTARSEHLDPRGRAGIVFGKQDAAVVDALGVDGAG